jgi:uncharacterized membrane protein
MFGTFLADKVRMKARTFIVSVGALYVATLVAMFTHGWEIPAAYLAMPAWYVVASPFFVVAGEVSGTIDLLGWQAWNTLLLMVSGSLNVFAAYWIAKKIERS